MYAYVNGKRFSLDPTKARGKGGEADIYEIEAGIVAKIFKTPDHIDFAGLPAEQKAAVARIAEHQKKLRNFPRGLPDNVISPKDLVTDQSGNKILGYTMPFLSGAEVLLKYSDEEFRRSVPNQEVVRLFLDIHSTVGGVHAVKVQTKPVVIGDFNDLNVLVVGQSGKIIDADSMDFGSYRCRVFTQRFVDPLNCDPQASSLTLVRPHNTDSDWYAFAVMLFQSLLFVDPFGGVYRPKDLSKKIPHDQRPLKRITVLNPEVRYPKAAVPYGVLSDDLLQYFHQLFEKDNRGVFPRELLENLRWTKCTQCGTEHARGACPSCKFAAPSAPREVVRVHGEIVVTKVFFTTGQIVHSRVQNGRLLWLFHENGKFQREDRSTVFSGNIDRGFRFRLQGSSTLIGKKGQVLVFKPGQNPTRLGVDSYGTVPMFETNSRDLFYLESGRLLKNQDFAPEHVGDVLSHQTLFWVGEKMGFGLYRAGNICVSFTFDPLATGINDNVKLPTLRGQVFDSYCLFSGQRAWFFVSTREGGKTINYCHVVNLDGTIEATHSTEEGSGDWLSSLRGKAVVGNLLFAPSDDGISRVEIKGQSLELTKTFSDTESFVDAKSQLHVRSDGIYVVKGQEILLLKLK